jgi:hypothetical protein
MIFIVIEAIFYVKELLYSASVLALALLMQQILHKFVNHVYAHI